MSQMTITQIESKLIYFSILEIIFTDKYIKSWKQQTIFIVLENASAAES